MPRARGKVGVNVAVVVADATVPATAIPPGPVTVNVLEVIVVELIASVNVIEITCAAGTPTAPVAGNVETMVGASGKLLPDPVEHPVITRVARSARIQDVRSITLFM